MMRKMHHSWPLFWCLEPETQAALMQYQWDNYELKLDIPTPHQTSKGVWLNTQLENADEIDRLIRQTRRHFKGGDSLD